MLCISIKGDGHQSFKRSKNIPMMVGIPYKGMARNHDHHFFDGKFSCAQNRTLLGSQ
jgi:hypothetical protein